MFILDWALDWLFGEAMKFFQTFFTIMGNMGIEIFDYAWVQGIVYFFRMLGWSLYLCGLVVLIFDTAISAQQGRANLAEAGLNALKGFFAVSLFTIMPIELYRLAITLQNQLGQSMATLFQMTVEARVNDLIQNVLNTILETNPGPFNLFTLIAVGYCVLKIFFANIKRGGIILINIAVGSLYMFNLPRGFNDGFLTWCKQVIAICLTAFLQMTLLTAGLITFSTTNAVMGIGIMLAANEVPRIAESFGLDTSAKANISSMIHVTQAAVNTTGAIIRKAAH